MTYSGSWTAYEPTDEPASLTRLWRSTQQAFHAAMLAHDMGRDAKDCLKLQALAYSKLRSLRLAGAFRDRQPENVRPCRTDSELVRFGDTELRHIRERRARAREIHGELTQEDSRHYAS